MMLIKDEGIVADILCSTIPPYKRLRNESKRLKSFFSTDKGIDDLIVLFLYSERNRIEEPIVTLYEDGRFESVRQESTKSNKKIYDKIFKMSITKEPDEDVKEFRDDLEETIKTGLNPEKKITFLLKSLDRFLEKGDNIGQVILTLERYFSSHAKVKRERPKGEIVLHVHRRHDGLIFDDKYGYVTGAKKGYSPEDIRAGANAPLGLIEYDFATRKENNLPMTEITFDISHML